MYSIVYLSVPNVEFTMKDIEGLIQKSAKSNQNADISGILLYKSGMFVQLLEGDKEAVTGLYEKIKGDYRHKNVKILLETDISARRFPSWSMAFSLIPKDNEGFEWLNTLLLVQAGTKHHQELIAGLSDNSMIAGGD